MIKHPLPKTQDERQQILRDNNAKEFITAVKDSKEQDTTYLIMTLSAFAGEPELLHVALDYASVEGVSVLMSPA